MSNSKPQSKRKPKYTIDNVKVSSQDVSSVRSVMDKFLGRVALPADLTNTPTPGESTTIDSSTTIPPSSSIKAGSTIQPSNPSESSSTIATGSTSFTGSTSPSSTSTKPSTTIHSSTTDDTSTTASPSSTNPASTTSLHSSTSSKSSTSQRSTTIKPSTTRTTSSTNIARRHDHSVSPQRDFVKVPNSVVRDALAAGLFKGKSKQVWDYLWSESRGYINPQRIIRRSRPQIRIGAGLGSMVTVDQAIKHLFSVGLLAKVKVKGEPEGNHYEVFTPEETGWLSPPILGGSTDSSSTTKTEPNLVALEAPENGTTSSTATSGNSVTYGPPNTSFKTNTIDDEATHQLTVVLSAAAEELTGSRPSAAEREKWAELGEVIAEELRAAASRTKTVSNVPAFLTAHLRRCFASRRLREDVVVTRKTGETAREGEPGAETNTSRDLTGPVEMMRELIERGGYTREMIDEQFKGGFGPEDWQTITESLET